MQFFSFTNPHFYIAVLLSVVNAFVLVFLSGKFMQVIQQGGYSVKSCVFWLQRTKLGYIYNLLAVSLISLFLVLVSNSLFDVYHNQTYLSYIGLAPYCCILGAMVKRLFKQEEKLPLVKTKRIIRWGLTLFLLYFVVTFTLIAFSNSHILLLRFGAITITPIFVPVVVIIGFYIVLPIEYLVSRSYILRAKRKLKKAKGLKIVAITGSYAKTSNKFILKQMLEKKFKTLASPKSYNTPLGLTRTVLQDLQPSHQVFIAEFGANKRGDIKELCNFIKPDFGIITGVGNQHLTTFKTQETISKTKFELADYLKNSIIVFGGDNSINLSFYPSYKNDKKILTFKNNSKGFSYCKDEKVTYKGTRFTLVVDGKQEKCQTKLLGQHNLENFAMCAAFAYKMGVDLKDIASAISELLPIKHRLEIITSDQNYVVIDDSFNASVQGATAALNALDLFKGYTKIIVTPGIVEMGELKNSVNKKLGNQVAQVCDFAVIVNQINRQALVQGMSECGMKKNNIFPVETLQQAQEKLKQLRTKKTVVLFENDLPDLFT